MEKINVDRTKTLVLLSKFRMIANPIAHKIILILEEEGGLNVGTIQNKLKIDQPLTSGYLIKMKNKGLLKSLRKGKETIYSLKKEYLVELLECAEELVN